MPLSSRPTVVVDNFDNLRSTYIREQISVEEVGHTVVDNYPPNSVLLCNLADTTYPIYSGPDRIMVPNGIQAQSFALWDFPNDFPPLSGYMLVGPTANSTESVSSTSDSCPPPYFGYTGDPLLYQETGTMFEAPLPTPSGISYSNPLAHSQVIQDPSHTDAIHSTTVPHYPTSSVFQLRNHPAIHPNYQASPAASEEVLPPFPTLMVPVVNEAYVAAPSSTVHTHQCSFTCSTESSGSTQEMRRHLIQEHRFRGAAKESIQCLWGGCERILQRENIPRHIITCHLGVKVRCTACGTALSRRDVLRSHARVCRAKGQASASQPHSTISDGSNRTMSTAAGVVRPLDTTTTPGRASHTTSISTTLR